MSAPDLTHLSWEVRRVSQRDRAGSAGWLEACQRFRSQVLYERGRRPEFGPGGPYEIDTSPLDQACYHLIVRTPAGEIVGTIRVSLLGETPACVTEQLLGADGICDVADALGQSPHALAEQSRWSVHEQWRTSGIGTTLVWAGNALARALGAKVCIGAPGREGAGLLVRHAGMFIVHAHAGTPSPLYDDEISIVAMDFSEPDEGHEKRLRQALALLDLSGLRD